MTASRSAENSAMGEPTTSRRVDIRFARGGVSIGLDYHYYGAPLVIGVR